MTDKPARKYVTVDGRQWANARLTYTKKHGPLPAGYDVHHYDGDHSNDAIENLYAMPWWAHNQLHRWQRQRGRITREQLTAFIADCEAYLDWYRAAPWYDEARARKRETDPDIQFCEGDFGIGKLHFDNIPTDES